MTDDWMADLRDRYARALPERVDELRRLVHVLESTPVDREARDAASGAFHRLHGSAGSYGFHDISALAGKCEKEIDQSLGTENGYEAVLERIRTSLEQLAAAAAAAVNRDDEDKTK